MKNLKLLIDGRLGLSNTFYIFGVLFFLIFSAPKSLLQDGTFLWFISSLIFAIYSLFIAVALTKAALSYKGSFVWKYLAITYAFFILGIQLPGFVLIDLLGI